MLSIRLPVTTDPLALSPSAEHCNSLLVGIDGVRLLRRSAGWTLARACCMGTVAR
ncbi:MAG: hypothetical protein KF817_15465 [Phycisphaeraceae bacterium]|nr:hypothetical protein [Phycisphaeraceae bacterium]